MRQRTGGLVVIGIAAMLLAFPQTSWGVAGLIIGDCVRTGVLGEVLGTTAVAHMVTFVEDTADPVPLRVDVLAEVSSGATTEVFRVHLNYTGAVDVIPLACALTAALRSDVVTAFGLSATTELFITGDPGDEVFVPAKQSGISQADIAPVPGSQVFFDKGGTRNDSGYTGDADMSISRFNIVACDPSAAGTTCAP